MTAPLSRREFRTVTAVAATLAGCGIQARSIAPAPVSILQVAAYFQSIYDTIRRLLLEHPGDVWGRSIPPCGTCTASRLPKLRLENS